MPIPAIKTRHMRTSNRAEGRKCPRSTSVLYCNDSCKSCHRFTRTGHDHREPMFRDYLSEAERGHDAWY